MWSMAAQRLTQITHPAATPDKLCERVEAAWSAVSQEHIQSLFESIPRRVAACNNRIVTAQRKHLDDFLRGRIIGRLECGRTQLEIFEELGIAQSIISRLWQRFQDDATSTTVSRQTVYRRLGHIGLYARRPVRCVPLTATHCRLRLTWSREHALWTPQQWSCVMLSDESRFSLQSDSRRTLIWRAPGTRYPQENPIE
ncbi:transposable element Tcb1 transposase [Trichonephila clavipes]|uniref:Transposable element Tcb1 transposase n=1 Tax=Trichonephila clavipes TaxID=2585209 RepID=A0A8X7BFY4_TRICX|nr:transposable element Tcb1 transposase [Trichonephila clavipes]